MSEILVWDRPGPPVDSDATLILWRSCDAAASSGVVSIQREVERHAQTLKQRYLAWIYELGETRIGGMRVVDRLELRPGFSYWWMTPLAEKCNYDKSPWIDDAVKLMALEGWVVGRGVQRVRLASANAALAECLRRWCAKSGLAFEWQAEFILTRPKPMLRRIYEALPTGLRAGVWLLRYVVDRWPLRNAGVEAWKSTSARITFVSYLFNLTPDAFSEQRFASRYWTELPEMLAAAGRATNWLHLYVKGDTLPDAASAVPLLRGFWRNSKGKQTHVALDSFLGGRVIARTLRDWIRLVFVASRLEDMATRTTSGNLNLWPLFSAEWRNSTVGTAAMNNLLYLNLLEAAMAKLPQQQVGVFLQENQGWESGLLYAWRTAGHGRLIGCPHSTVRYWDLRYFFDTRSYARGRNALPMPDRVAINGMAMRNQYLKGDYPAGDLVDVEALRYLYLATRSESRRSGRHDSGPHLLVLCDYTARHTAVQMHLLVAAAKLMPVGTTITVKPHPAYPIRAEDYPDIAMTIAIEPIADLLARCDLAFTSATTSAAVDAYCAGIPVVSVLDGGSLNQSPLRGYDSVHFIGTPEELAAAVVWAARAGERTASGRDFFFLDDGLPRWRNLLLGAVSSYL